MPVIFSESSGVADSVFGKVQAPVRAFVEERAEEFEKNSVLKDLFHMGSSQNYGDLYTGMTSFDDFEPVGENGAYPETSMQEGYQKLLVYETWKLSFALSAEIMEDGKIMDLTKQPRKFMTAYGRTREKFGAALYGCAMNGASTMTYKGKTYSLAGADGQKLFSKTHPSKVKGGDQTNMFSNAFSVDALGRAESAMHVFKDDNGQILDVAPDTIVIPDDADLKKDVFAAIGADKEPTTANNAFNYQFGRWKVIVWSYLNQFITAGAKPWVLLDSKFNETYEGAVWNDRIPLSLRSTIDENTDANVWRGRARFNACFNDWRFACCGGMTGGTSLGA